MMFDIKEELKLLPQCSGVYVMLDEFEQILYVGKAKNLKSRVRQYFQNAANLTEKTIHLVQKIKSFRYIITNNEVEALVLENNLIKEHKPYYNILLKDDKTYPYIKIKLKEKYPQVTVVRKLRADGSRYFGPYMIGITSKEIIELIHRAFPIRSCSQDISKPSKNRKPCLNYHIKRCLAPCVENLVTPEQYGIIIKQIIDFLSGNDKLVQNQLYKKMITASGLEEFELAKDYRDSLNVLDKLIRKQVTALPRDLNMDIFAYANNGIYGVINIMIVRGGKLIGADNYPIGMITTDGVLSTFIMQNYTSNPIIADEIVTAEPIDFAAELADYLTSKAGTKINIISPQAGVRRQLADMAYNNASEYLEKSVSKIASKEALTIGSVSQLQSYLILQIPPRRIECYDISNISGVDKVASMVVFINGDSAKEHYRKFKIKTVKGIDDFASMKEVISRRIAELNSKDISFRERPDLIVVDGGKGQLSSAYEIIKSTGINIIGLAKREEEVFVPETSLPIIIPRDTLALKLLQRVRDEAHRFAVTFHRSLRSERQTKSILTQIEGIGTNKARQLLIYFKKIDKIASATEEELMQVEGIGKVQSKHIFDYFKNKA